MNNTYRIVITDPTGHEVMNMTSDYFEDVPPHENVAIILGRAFQETVQLIPKSRRDQMVAEMDADTERALRS